MKSKWGLVLVLAVCSLRGEACTNLIVGKNASADGSVIVSYSADDFGSFGYLRHFAAGKHGKGSMRPVYNWETNNYAGEIEEAAETYNVIGNMNHRTAAGQDGTGGYPRDDGPDRPVWLQ